MNKKNLSLKILFASLRHCVRFLVVFFVCSISTNSTQAQEWTRFRGINGDGIVSTKTIPTQITEKNYHWKIELPGEGHSSPVIWKNRIFITSAEEEKRKRHLLCIDTSNGKTLWTKVWDYKNYHRHEFNSHAASTPTVDTARVYITLPSEDSFWVIALNHQGKEIWKRDLGEYKTQHGGAASPMLVGNRLIIAKEPEGGKGLLCALDTKTGDFVWKIERETSIRRIASFNHSLSGVPIAESLRLSRQPCTSQRRT